MTRWLQVATYGLLNARINLHVIAATPRGADQAMVHAADAIVGAHRRVR